MRTWHNSLTGVDGLSEHEDALPKWEEEDEEPEDEEPDLGDDEEKEDEE